MIEKIYDKDIDLSVFRRFKIDCEKCCGLCCVALYFTKSDGFPEDKEAGTPCKYLRDDYNCKIYSKLSKQGMKGCMAYDCFGAGQFVTSHLNSLPDWYNISSKEAAEIFDTYLVVLRVHQTLWYLTQCSILQLPRSEKEQAKSLINEGCSLIEKPSAILSVLDLDAQPFYEKSNEYLKHICVTYQTYNRNISEIKNKNFMGKNMQRKNLKKLDFSMSLLIAANLTQANLSGTNFLGADMRDTNICGTDLSQSLFLTQIQINTAKGNKDSILPPYLHKPKTWGCN